VASNRHLQFLGRSEGDFLAGFNLDCFSGGWIAAHASGALSHLQNAETGNTNPLPLLEMLGDEANKPVEQRPRPLWAGSITISGSLLSTNENTV
jgi:hypothetical protein